MARGNTQRGQSGRNTRSGRIGRESPPLNQEEPVGETEIPTSPVQPEAAAATPAQGPGIDYTALATAFRACQNMENASAVPAAQPEPNRWLTLSSRIVRLCPREFLGNEGVVAAERWLQEIKRHLEVMGCTPTEQIKLAVYRLAGKARSWWEACIRHYGKTRIDALTWDEFCQLFERKFVPVHERTKLREQYESLVQGRDRL